MSEKDAGRAAVIMAWGKAISLVIGSVAGAITAITTFLNIYFKSYETKLMKPTYLRSAFYLLCA